MSSRVVAGRDTGTLVAWVVDARDRTLGLLDELDDAQLDMPPYLPTVNPFRWEIGHVAWFQDHFVLQGGLGLEATERGAAQLYGLGRGGPRAPLATGAQIASPLARLRECRMRSRY